MSDGFNLDDYVDVAERITVFREKYPEGSFQTTIVPVPVPFNENFVAVEARAYRSPTDERPGIDIAWEPVPGKTPYTKDSELMNASTSAVGRAIVYALAADTNRGISTKQEVQNRQNGESEKAGAPKISTKQLQFLVRLLKDAEVESSDVNLIHSWALDNLSGGRNGSGSKAIEGLKNDRDATVERLLKAALEWQKGQTDLAVDTEGL